MSVQNPVPQTPVAPQPEPSVKKPLAFAALALTVVSSIIILAGHIITARQALSGASTLDIAAVESAGDTLVIFVAIAAIMNLVAFILGLIALIKSNPKTLPIIIFVVVIVLPGIALFVGRAIQTSMLSSALS